VSFIFAVIIFILDIFAILKIAQSSATTIMKAVWIVVVLVLPLLGLITWYLAGPGDKSFKM
jgi:hypothetical protein